MIFREIKRLILIERKKRKKETERKKERNRTKERKRMKERNYFSKTVLQIKNAEFSSVKFENDFDDSINFHSVNFH